MKKIILTLLASVAMNVFATTFEEKEPIRIVLKEKPIKDDGRTSDILEAYENDATLSILPYLSISNATVIISGNGVVENYHLSFMANQMQTFNISGYDEGNYLLQVILPDGDVLSGDFVIE